MPRAYDTTTRDITTAETRTRLLETANRLLRAGPNRKLVSLDAVAKAAGVTRLTVYNQFGSRRGLFEAVFDQRAQAGGLDRIAEAMSLADPREGLRMLIRIFCEFWGGEPAVGRLHGVAALDPEFAKSLVERNERRRRALALLVRRMAKNKDPTALSRHDLVDLLFSLTGFATFDSLTAGRSLQSVADTLVAASDALLSSAGL